MHRSKVPNGADAAVHEQVAYLLRARRGNGDYAYMYVHLAAEALELGYREDRLALELGGFFAEIERCDYIEAVGLEAAVIEQSLAEAACADYNGVVDIVIAEESLKLRELTLARSLRTWTSLSWSASAMVVADMFFGASSGSPLI